MKFFDFVFAKKIFQYTSESMPMVINDIQLELLKSGESGTPLLFGRRSVHLSLNLSDLFRAVLP